MKTPNDEGRRVLSVASTNRPIELAIVHGCHHKVRLQLVGEALDGARRVDVGLPPNNEMYGRHAPPLGGCPTRRRRVRSWAAAASVLLPGLIAIAGSSLPLSAQDDVVEECQPEVPGTVDVAITYRPTTPNPLANLHGLRLVANDRSSVCAALVHPGRTTLFRGVPPGEYTFHLNWNPIGRLPLSVPDTSIAISLDVPAENRVEDCLEVEACRQALLDAPAYVEGAPEAYLFHLAAVLNGVRDPDEALCVRAPGEALEAVRERYPATRVGPDCAGGHFIRVADVERDGPSIIARLSAGILRPDRGSYWPTGYRCLIEDTGTEYRAVQCVISSMA